MTGSQTYNHFDFANRHFKGLFDTLNAASAISRAEQLLSDIKQMKSILAASPNLDAWHRLEFPNYYIVGLVTCLEWHSRSRLHDLLKYDPKNFSSDDVKSLSGSKLETLLQENFTVAQLVSASTLVSDFNKYIAIFDRILKYLKIKESVADIVKLDSKNPRRIFGQFEGLFVRRHLLVHEIDPTQIGSWGIRESLSLEEAEELAQAVIDLMMRIESAISKAAKRDFPNLIYAETKKVRAERLLDMILEIEDELIRKIQRSVLNDSILDKFVKSIESSRDHINVETEIISNLEYPGQKYYDLRTPLINALYEGRLAYVSRLAKELFESGAIEEVIG